MTHAGLNLAAPPPAMAGMLGAALARAGVVPLFARPDLAGTAGRAASVTSETGFFRAAARIHWTSVGGGLPARKCSR